jgi:uncharacterized membrane protein HdeD (DUF308 family)
MIVAGVAEVVNAFQIKSRDKCLLWALLGVFYIVAGFGTFQNPLFAAVLLTLALGASFVASGTMRIILAFSMKRETPWIWVGAIRHDHADPRHADSGALADQQRLRPGSLFLGIDLILAGAGWIGIGLGLRGRRAWRGLGPAA